MIPHKDLLWTVPVATSDKPDPSASTNDNHPDGRFISVIHHYHSQKSYSAKVDKRSLA